jgi:hypothetical protein
MEKYNYTDLIAYKKQLYNTLLSKVGSGELNAYDAILQLNSNNIKCIVTTNAHAVTTNTHAVTTNTHAVTTNAHAVTTNIDTDTTNAHAVTTNAHAVTTNIDAVKCPNNIDEFDEINDISGDDMYNEYRNGSDSAYNSWKRNEKKSKYSKYKINNKPINDTSIQNDIWERKPYKIHTDINKQNLSFNIEINKSITVNGLNRKYPITMYYNEWKLLQQHLNNELDKFHEENKY